MLPTYLAKDDTYVLPSFLPVPDVPAPGFGKLMVNSYLIKAKEPILIDAGMPIVKEDFLKELWSLVDPEDLKWIFLSIFNRLNHPWFALVDQSKFEATVESIRRLEPDIIAGCHAPLAKGPRVEAHLQAMANLPAQGPLDLPDQATLDGILAAIQGGGDGH